MEPKVYSNITKQNKKLSFDANVWISVFPLDRVG